jgi:stress-induced-phosphoprotein 1
MERPEGSNEMPPGVKQDSESSAPAPTPSSSASKPAKKKPTPKEEPKEEPMDVDDPDAQAKKEADTIKAQGTVAYKARKFDEAIEHYSKAWELYPKDVTFLTNLSGKLSTLLLAQTVIADTSSGLL